MLCQILADLVIRLFRHSVVNIQSRIDQQRQIGSVRRGGIRGSVNLCAFCAKAPPLKAKNVAWRQVAAQPREMLSDRDAYLPSSKVSVALGRHDGNGTFDCMFRISLILTLTISSLLAQTAPPLAPKKPVIDTYNAVKVTDDYRWLENFDDPAVKQWTDAQNAAARSFLEALPDRDALSRELRQVFQPAQARYFPIQQRGGKIFAMKSDPRHQHQIVVTLDSLDNPASEHTVLDPDAIDDRHLTEIDFAVPSVDGRYLAASLSTGGSESGDLHVYETATGKPLRTRSRA
jgi:hypothetical protein